MSTGDQKYDNYLRLRKGGCTLREIAEAYGVSRQAVHNKLSRGPKLMPEEVTRYMSLAVAEPMCVNFDKAIKRVGVSRSKAIRILIEKAIENPKLLKE